MHAGFRIRRWEVAPQLNELASDDATVRVEPKVMEVLVALVDHYPDVVAKNDLIGLVWGEAFVTDEVLTNAIWELRRALGDDARNPRFIQTIRGRGYRLIAEPEATEPASPEASQPVAATGGDDRASTSPTPSGAEATGGALHPADNRSRSSTYAVAVTVLAIISLAAWLGLRSRDEAEPTRTIDSLAVLPLVDLSPTDELGFLVDGLTDSVILELAEQPALRVISRTSSQRFRDSQMTVPEIATILNVEALIEGSASVAPEAVDVSIRLVGTEPERLLSTHTYQRSLDELPQLHREIAFDVAADLGLRAPGTSLPPARTVTPEVHALYVRARRLLHQQNPELIARAREYLQEAIDADPEFAAAYAALADSYPAASIRSDEDSYLRAKGAAVRAIELDASLVEAHLALARIRGVYEWDWDGVEESLARALAANPNHPNALAGRARFYSFAGQHERARRDSEAALAADPLSLFVWGTVLLVEYQAGGFDRTIEQAQRALELNPGFQPAYLYLGLSYIEKQRYDEALAALDFARLGGERIGEVAYAFGRAGQPERARALIGQLLEHEPPASFFVALGYVGLGEEEQALDWLERAFSERRPELVRLNADPRLDPLRDKPRFIELQRLVGLGG